MILRNEGVEEISGNREFDPMVHEAVLTEKSDQAKGTVLEVLQKGYMIKGTILRAAKVKVAI